MKSWVGVIREIRVRTVVVQASTMEEARYQLAEGFIVQEIDETIVDSSRKIVREFANKPKKKIVVADDFKRDRP